MNTQVASASSATFTAEPTGYRLVMADPAWSFSDKLPGEGRGAEKHYGCISLQEIMDFPLPFLADDCLLMLWRVAAMQQEALDVMEAWGFAQKTELVWVKLTSTGQKMHFGMGRYLRASHEICLIGTRGRVLVDDHSIRSVLETDGVFDARVQEHSRKPDEIYDIAERLVPGGPYLEVFARRYREGWDAIGNELPRAVVQ